MTVGRGTVRISGLGGCFGSIGTISSVDFSIRRNRLFNFLNIGNTKGSAMVGVLYALCGGSNKDIHILKGRIKGSSRGVQRSVKVIRRRGSLSRLLAIGRGLRVHKKLCNRAGRGLEGGFSGIIGLLKLGSFLGEPCKGLSKNRGHETRVTTTLVRRPGVLFLSRPAAKLSPTAEGGI